MSTFTGFLRSRTDDELVALLRGRPDLASPSPTTIASLGVRATSRGSLERALASVDAGVLQVLEAVVALGPGCDLHAAIADSPASAALVDQALARATELVLLFRDEEGLHPAPGLVELLGPYPAGLAPAGPTDPPAGVVDVLPEAPAGVAPVLEALTWGPPVGLAPSHATATAAAVDWMVRRRLLVMGDGRHVILPRTVALALRGGRTHRAAAVAPTPVVPVRRAATVLAEGVDAGERVVRLVTQLGRLWEEFPASVLRSGGLGVRELRRVAAELDVEERLAALVVELAAAAGLVGDDGEEQPTFVPTVAMDEWSVRPVAERWSALAATWLATPRTPWLVGGRDEAGVVRPALSPDLQRAWAPRLRRSVLGVLAELEPGAAPSPDAALEVLAWRTPRSVPPIAAVAAILAEAADVGVLGAGALSEPGRALLSSADEAAAAFDAALPPSLDEILLQGDLTGIVPGRPSDELEALLARTARVESRGGAVTVRFTADSVRTAFDDGATAEGLLAELGRFARGPVPQPLEYLVRDAARRHGRLRAGAASSYLRSDDPALLAGLVDNPRLSGLGLFALAPTVLAAHAPTRELIDALRAQGLAPAAETPDGHVLHIAREVRRVGRRGRSAARRREGGEAPASASDAQLAALVARLRAPEPVAPELPAAPATAADEQPEGTDEPGDALLLLREAAADKTEVWVELVGPTGRPERRLLRPLRIDGGRLRAADVQRESELTVAVHRIASVRRVRPAAADDATTDEETA
ncbi:helicase-associated domain-containing protein [Cellulomonas edaphi]|uniref:Helicase-associated domain-containing protein n=1 Tax=Cellulomonas edaphi TaxID=3053468 RepID=A0ABT7S4H1_9CELL|nr:helicase-associated domain-containing protein [Cellulomons edaphi]MDM7830523.1 helicase-associated domain-containing protein [Cellulomons edaphi]